jgi:hypothetical protein
MAGGAGIRLQQVDWKTVAIPGAACFRTAPIRLRGGEALVPDPVRGQPVDPGSSGPKFDQVAVGFSPVKYGMLTPAHQVAALTVSCNDNGGTADGALLYSVVVYAGWTRTLRAIGLISPRVQPAGELPTLLEVRHIGDSDIVALENFYGPKDGTCCPSGQAVTTWHYSAGHLSPIGTTTTRNADSRTNV